MSPDIAAEIEAYAAKLNGRPRAADQLRHEELELYDADLAKARARMEQAYLENQPTREDRTA
jgi:hypothetical protein